MGRTEDFTAATFRFDAFELDTQRRTLRRTGADVELRPLAFDALAHLVRHAGHVVTKDELIAAVWPGLVVTDDSIARCISDIRRALGDVEQRIIKTVPRRGYTLAVPVGLDGPVFARPEPAVLTVARIEAVPPAPMVTDPGQPPVRGSLARRWALAPAWPSCVSPWPGRFGPCGGTPNPQRSGLVCRSWCCLWPAKVATRRRTAWPPHSPTKSRSTCHASPRPS
jgi:DNA-binding winged helix-turn-helix (wHTH) protein